MRPALLALILCLSCGGSDAGPDVATPPPAVELSSSEVLRAELVEPIYGTGTIAPHKTTNVSPLVDGVIEEIHVQVGDRVAQGAPLFRTRPLDYEIRLAEARAASKLARAEAENARRNLDRVMALAKRNVVSADQLDDARTNEEILSARLEAAQASLKRAEQDLADTIVRAPYVGVITQKFVDEGAFMRTMMTGQSPVVQIMKTDIVAAIVYIPEAHLRRVHLGTLGRVTIDGLDSEYDSSVYILNDRVDPESHTIEVRLAIRNDDLAIKPGLFAKATLFPEAVAKVLVAREAVLGYGTSRYVFLASDGHAERRDVNVRELDAVRLEVLEGLEPGDRVLIGPNLARVRTGDPIQIREARVDL